MPADLTTAPTSARPAADGPPPDTLRSARPWWIGLGFCLVSIAATMLFVDRQQDEVELRIAQKLRSSLDVAIADYRHAVSVDPSASGVTTDFARIADINARFENLTGLWLMAISPAGEVVSRSAGIPPELGGSAAALQAAAPGRLVEIEPAGGPRYLAVTAASGPAAAAPLTIAVIASARGLLADFHDNRRQAWLQCIGFVIIVLAMTWAFSRHLVRRDAFEAALQANEAALQAQKLRLIEAQQLAKCGSWEVSFEPESFAASQAYLDIYQMTMENCPRTGEAWIARFLRDPADIAEARAALATAERGLPTEGVRHVTLDDGRRKWIHYKKLPKFDDRGKLCGFHGIARDITAEREAIDRLVERTAELERAKKLAGVGSWRWEVGSDRLTASVRMKEICGIDTASQPATFRAWSERFIHPEDLPAYWPAYDARFHARPFDRERRIVDAHGKLVWIRTIAEPVFGNAGELVAYDGVTIDISAHKHALLELSRQTELLLAAQQVARMGSWHWDLASDRLEITPEYRLLYRLPEGTIAPATMSEWLGIYCHPEEAALAQQSRERICRGESLDIHRRIVVQGGETRWIHVIAHPVRDDGGAVVGCTGVSRDITIEKQRELALEVEVSRRQELERNMLMTIEMELAQVGLELHDELGQDLTGIALLSKSLERRLAEKGLDAAADAARISSLVNRTIGHTRMISHGLSPYIWGMDGLVGALGQLASDINSLGIVTVETRLDPSIEIHDDLVARSLYRISQESINNALKHSHAQRIKLSLSSLKGGVELTISDNGTASTPAAADDALESGSRFHSIRHRCSAIDAALSIRRGRQGGTSVRVIWHGAPGTRVAAAATSANTEVL